MTRLALGGIWHETNTFVPSDTSFADFEQYQLAAGNDLIDRYKGTGTELGGAIQAAHEAGIEVVPLFYAAAVPSGIVTQEAHHRLSGELSSRLRAAGPVDGVVLTLHGAMVAQNDAAPEVILTKAARNMMGPAVPIAVTLDLHGNLSDELCKAADIVVGYHTFPHVDMFARGREAVDLIQRMRAGKRPRFAHVKLPLLTVPQMQSTDDEPMRRLVDAMDRVVREPGVWTASMLPGYPYSDTPQLGYSVYVAADSDSSEIANSLAELVWSLRSSFKPVLLEPSAAIAQALHLLEQRRDGPVILVDVADNVGGGSPGSGTNLLRALIEHGINNAVTVLWDPRAIDEVYSGNSNPVEVIVGAASDRALGDPIAITGTARRLGRVIYKRSGPYMAGQQVDMGRVAVIHTLGGDVVLTEMRVMPFDDDHITACGINPRLCSVIVVKSAIAWKAAFGSYAQAALFVRTPGYCPSDLSLLSYRNAIRAFPLQEDVQWEPT